MQTSVFIAKLMGPMLLMMGLSVLLNRERVRAMAQEFLEGDALIFMSGVITLPVGLAIVNTHNVWTAGWPVIITLFGWGMIVAGVLRMAMPATLKRIGATMIDKTTYLAIPGALMALLGAYLSYQGYLG